MCNRRKQAWSTIIIGNVLIYTIVIASPIYVSQFQPGSTGRNIRHLPCVSRRSGETGVCMFAFTCAKANGTHLGTCIDRFYFGSCCKIDDEPDIFPQDNSIDDSPPAPRPFITTHRPTGSSGIPEYFTKPKPTDEKKPVEASQITTISGFLNTQSTQTSANTMRETTKFVTKKPTITTIEMTTQTTRLSTFQTVQNAAGLSTEATLKATNNTVNIPAHISSSITRQPTKPTILDSTFRPSTVNLTKLTTITSETTAKKPIISTTTVQKPMVQTSQKPFSSTTRPIVQHESTTIKNDLTITTQKVVPSTRFPPRNTTSIKPLNQTTTRKPSTKRPSTTVTTKRPVVTTKKPTTLTKRPSTPTKPLTNSSFGTTLPAITKPHSTSGSFSNGSFSTSADRATESTLAFIGIRPTAMTVTTNIIQKTTITPANLDHKGSIKTTTPKTTLKPTSTVRTTTARPSTTTKTTINRPITTKPSSSTTTKLKPTKITSTTTKITKPEYTSATIITEGTKPLSSTISSTLSVTRPKPSTTKPTPLTKLPVNTSSIVEVTTSTSSSISTFTVKNESISTHVTPTKGQNVNHTLEEIPLTTYSPGLVTWSSNSDEVSTKAVNKTISSTSTSMSSTPTSTSTLTLTSTTTIASSSEQVETDWSPITTPDGWIMIQSPTTEKLPEIQESSTEPVTESPIQSLTSAKPITESSIIPDIIKRPTVTTLLSTIASVTIDMELPVPMETLNMSDYKQVCGRRMFPEPKIVGGERSSFGKWPWQISLRQWRSQTYLHKCGAALLNENWAITAAHCVESVPPSELLLRIGEHDLANEDEPYGYQERRVQIVASHPQFDARTFEYDLALLRFYEPLLPFQPNVLPICLPDDDETYVGRTAYVTGWGRLYDEGPLPSVLQEVAVPVINNTVCEAMYKNAGYIEHIPHIFICAGWRNGGFDSCEGDSGGPMVIQRARDKRWILAGIISWGIGCAAPNQPGVYTRISEFRDWINQILQF
ncbi:PREDICTED: serine proteinase stubble [Atta cephalotes]|uniref:Peptidase S1 domain-containing protein n=1 Tax=Atta cephalotes TaxID=12957 RepID=A0A158P489_ATTCE|nr:PREDICTED: serine proteinase stubble [Atta cephalotes]